MQTANVEISLKSVIKIIVLLLALVFFWKIRFILLSVFSAYILMIGFAQLADWFTAKGFNKTLAAVFSYLILILFLAVVLFLIIPPLIFQIKGFLEQFPKYVRELNYLYSASDLPGVKTEDLSAILTSQINRILTNSVNLIFNTVNVFLNFLTVAVLSFYMLIERDRIKNNIFRLFPNLPKERVTSLAHKIEKQVGGWLKGELLLMFIIFVVTFVGLTLLRVEYALPLALLAGLLEAVPIIGPILSAVPAIIVTFAVSPVAALGVVVLYIFIQQLENNFLVPKIMQGVIGINPLLTILALLIGANFFGVIGAILSVPLAAIAQVVIYDLIEHQDFK